MRFRRLAHVSSALVALGALSGCNKPTQVQEGPAAQTTPSASAAAAPAVPSADEADNQLGAKLNGYVECLNDVSTHVVDDRRLYLAFADEKKGPTKGSTTLSLFLHGEDTCVEKLAASKAQPPALPALDTAAANYELALREVLPLIKQADDYYKQGNFKDDKLAKGKAMHAPLVAAFNKFADANKALADQVVKLNDELSTRRLAQLEKDQQHHLHYLIARGQKEAKALVEAADIRDLKQLDLPHFTALVGDFEKTVAEIDEYVGAAAHKAELDQTLAFGQFAPHLKAYLKTVKDLMRRKRDEPTAKKGRSSAGSSEGDPQHVLEEYNNLVASSNSLYYR
jgi:Protein of unknown function (DUF3829)